MKEKFYAEVYGDVAGQNTEFFTFVKGTQEEIQEIVDELNERYAVRESNNYDKFWFMASKELADPQNEEDYLDYHQLINWLNEMTAEPEEKTNTYAEFMENYKYGEYVNDFSFRG